MSERILRLKPEEVAKMFAEGKMELINQPRPNLEQARTIFGRDFLGPETVEDLFDVRIPASEVPAIPFSQEELKRAKDLDQFLLLRITQDQSRIPLTIQRMQQLLQPRFDHEQRGEFLTNHDWEKDKDFFTKDTPRPGWTLVSKQVISESSNKNYFDQTQLISDYLQSTIFNGMSIPSRYNEAISEFLIKKPEINILMHNGNADLRLIAKILAELRINQMTRQTPVEVIYDLASYFLKNGEKLGEIWTYTNRQAPDDGRLIGVGLLITANSGPTLNKPFQIGKPDGGYPHIPSATGVILSRQGN